MRKNKRKKIHRHNKSMETISMGKGLFLKPYKNGYGLLSKNSNTKNVLICYLNAH